MKLKRSPHSIGATSLLHLVAAVKADAFEQIGAPWVPVEWVPSRATNMSQLAMFLVCLLEPLEGAINLLQRQTEFCHGLRVHVFSCRMLRKLFQNGAGFFASSRPREDNRVERRPERVVAREAQEFFELVVGLLRQAASRVEQRQLPVSSGEIWVELQRSLLENDRPFRLPPTSFTVVPHTERAANGD